MRRYPLMAVSVAALVGYWLGRSRGQELWEAATARATDTLTENVQHLIDSRG